MRQILVLIGLPFSGKTTFARRLVAEDPEKTLLIERDVFLEELQHQPERVERMKREALQIQMPETKLYGSIVQNAYNDVLTKEYTDEVARRCRETRMERVIVDGLHLTPLSRAFVREVEGFQRIAVVMQTPLEVCLERFESSPSLLGMRGTLTEEKIRRLEECRLVPIEDDAFDAVLFVFPEDSSLLTDYFIRESCREEGVLHSL